MENEPEKTMDQTAAPGSQSSSAAPKRYVVNNGFDKVFFILSTLFLVVALFIVSIFGFLAVFGIPETRLDYVPGFVEYVTGNRYELVVHKLGPIDDNFFRSSTAYVLVRTDSDVVSNIEHMNALNFKFVPLDSPELEDLGYNSTAKIDKVYRELVGTPPGTDCRYFVTWDDPEYYTASLCFSPESKLLLVVRTGRK